MLPPPPFALALLSLFEVAKTLGVVKLIVVVSKPNDHSVVSCALVCAMCAILVLSLDML